MSTRSEGCKAAATVLILALLVLLVDAAPCTQADHTTCIAQAGLNIVDVLCLASDASTCDPDKLCTLDKWKAQFACVQSRCEEDFNEPGCRTTYGVCTQEFRDGLCSQATEGPTAPPTPAPPTPAPPTLPPGQNGVSAAKLNTSRPAQINWGWVSNLPSDSSEICVAYVGMHVAFSEANAAGGIDGMQLGITLRNSSDLLGLEGIRQGWLAMQQDNVFGFGYLSFEMSALAAEEYKNLGVPIVGAVASEPDTLYGPDKQNFINTKSGADQEMFNVVNSAVNAKQCTRFAIIWLDVTVVKKYVEQVTGILDEMGGYPVINVSYPYPPPRGADANFDGLFNQGFIPNCMFVFTDINIFGEWIEHIERHPLVDSETNYFSASLNLPVKQYQPAFPGGRELLRDKVQITVQLPDINNPQSDVAKQFLSAFNAHKGSLPAGYLANCPDPATAMLDQYIVGRQIVEIHRRQTSVTRQSFIDTVYRDKMFQVDDVVLGPYANECAPNAADKTKCFCNVGSRSAFITGFGADGFTVPSTSDPTKGEFGISEINVPLSGCRFTSVKDARYIAKPYKFGHFVTAAESGNAAVSLFYATARRYMIGANRLDYTNKVAARSYILSRTYTAADKTQTIQRLADRRGIIGVIGSTVTGADMRAAGLATTIVVDAMLPFELPYAGKVLPLQHDQSFDRGLIKLYPSLADHVHTLVTYANRMLGAGSSIAVVATDDGLAQLAEQSINTFGFEVGSKTVTGATGIAGAIGASGVFLIVTQNAAALAAALAAIPTAPSTSATYLVATSEELLHDQLTSFNAGSANALFASAFPAFWDPSKPFTQAFFAAEEAARPYDTTTPNRTAAPNPTELRAALAMMAMSQGSRTTTGRDPANFSAWWFQSGTKGIKDVAVGPLADPTCNNGLQEFRVLNLSEWKAGAAASAATASFRYRHEGCYVAYRPLPEESSNALLIGVASAAAAIVLIGAVAVVVIKRSGGRDVAAAPKDSDKPFAIVFTDIQSSTTLWANDPQGMSTGVEIHHESLRKLLKKHNGYEVKTIGDSFMVAFKDARDAAMFGFDIQTTFLKIDWPTTSFDEVYTEKIADALKADGKEDPALLEAMTSSEYWRGIRVRVGVHYGKGNVQLDPVTQGYDYYGTVVNTAARVEGVGNGGQVLLTEAAYDEVFGPSASNKPTGITCIDLGPQPLRGLSEKVRLHQCIPQELAKRQYAALRLDVENVAEEDDDENSSTHDSKGTSDSSLTGADAQVDNIIQRAARRMWRDPRDQVDATKRLHEGNALVNTLLSTTPVTFRTQFLQQMTQSWRVEYRAGGKDEKQKKHRADKATVELLVKVLKAIEVKENKDRKGGNGRRASDANGLGYALGAWTSKVEQGGSLNQTPNDSMPTSPNTQSPQNIPISPSSQHNVPPPGAIVEETPTGDDNIGNSPAPDGNLNKDMEETNGNTE